MLVFVEEGKPENLEKNPWSKARTNNKLNPLMTPGTEYEPGPHWWEVSALTTTKYLLPMHVYKEVQLNKLGALVSDIQFMQHVVQHLHGGSQPA